METFLAEINASFSVTFEAGGRESGTHRFRTLLPCGNVGRFKDTLIREAKAIIAAIHDAKEENVRIVDLAVRNAERVSGPLRARSLFSTSRAGKDIDEVPVRVTKQQ